jgi:hypothetical protein
MIHRQFKFEGFDLSVPLIQSRTDFDVLSFEVMSHLDVAVPETHNVCHDHGILI